MYLLLMVCSLVFANASPAKQPRYLHEVNGISDTLSLREKAPSVDTRSTGYALNLGRSPDSKNHACIEVDPISPFNDNSRSQMVDNFLPAPFRILALNCSRCPRDLRCSQTLLTRVTPPHNDQATPQRAGLVDYNAITGQKDSEIPTVVGQQPSPCPLQKCSEAGAPPCGPGAICRKDYCACPSGRKGQPFGLKEWMGLRVRKWPEALKVFVNPGVSCETPCDTPFCGEVRRGRGCDGLKSSQPGSSIHTVLEAIDAQEQIESVVQPSQSLGLEILISTLQSRIATSTSTPLGQIVSKTRVVPVGYVSHLSIALPQSTGERPMGAIPTRSATNDDLSLPMAPGGMGAIQKPGVPPLQS
ncbi:hypothetical protein PMIN01_00222 [Paraphaeosphaeria minitans]|uniref:Uncharacterized protein n=1 Tax=Paraphaeosphaeria minitans TaxID=565426 RepID=A0A9P6GT06_9PLEO|nr:hypothetical protein PMIN01_00222 [Paraphaeosphaeria minitans]